MTNFSKVYLLSRRRTDFTVSSLTELLDEEDRDGGYITTIFYIAADAKMDGL